MSAQFKLKRGNYAQIKEKQDGFNRQRKEKQPIEMPSAGSTFRRPQGYYAGKLIADCGLKGYTIGGAKVSEKHAGFVVNKGNATAADVLALINHIKKTVHEKMGVTLHEEVKIIG